MYEIILITKKMQYKSNKSILGISGDKWIGVIVVWVKFLPKLKRGISLWQAT